MFNRLCLLTNPPAPFMLQAACHANTHQCIRAKFKFMAELRLVTHVEFSNLESSLGKKFVLHDENRG